MADVLVNIPESAALGEIIEIKLLISHPMETGFRPLADGTLQPRDIITSVRCLYGGETVLEVDLHPAISANPFLAFHLRVDRSDEIVLEWTDWYGEVQREVRQIEVV
jgi:sulfur-oxidizing protein SoxZ